MGVASGWVGLSLRRVVGFGERVCGEGHSTDGKRMNGWRTLRTGWACPCGGLWVSAGVAVRAGFLLGIITPFRDRSKP